MADGSPTSFRVFAIPRKTYVKDNIDFPGPVVIEGKVMGDIRCMSLVVAEGGVVDGMIKADTVTVLGEVSGVIFATHLTLKTSSAVAADICHKHLSLEDGCFFEGRSRCHKNPLILV
jgi:cytoskeletal protein CcmA (bactofilin family)